MAKKKRGRMSGLRKMAKRAASTIASVVLIVGASHGVISAGVKAIQTRNVAELPRDLTYAYTGFDPQAGVWDQNQAVRSLGTILGAVAAAWLIRFAAKRV